MFSKHCLQTLQPPKLAQFYTLYRIAYYTTLDCQYAAESLSEPKSDWALVALTSRIRKSKLLKFES